MRFIFKYLIPSFLFVVVVLILTQETLSIIGNMILFLLVPVSIIYITALFRKELNLRERTDNMLGRNFIIITSLVSSISILLLLFSMTIHLAGLVVFKLIAAISVILSIGASLYFLIRNFRKFDYYIPYELFIVMSPSLILIGIFSFSHLIPKKKFVDISKNIELNNGNNQYLLDNYEFDSATLNFIHVLTEIETSLINASGGYLENGELMSGSSREYFYNQLYRYHAIDEIEKALTDLNMTEKDIEWLNMEEIANMTVADALFKIELLKNKILIFNLNKQGF